MSPASRIRRAIPRDWPDVFRKAPIGVLVLGALLFFLGAGLLLAGTFFLLAGRGGSWLTWATLAAGPLAVYVALSFVLLRKRAWMVVTAVLVLLATSALLRLFWTPGVPVSPAAEMIAAVAMLLYLRRPRVREAFGRVGE